MGRPVMGGQIMGRSIMNSSIMGKSHFQQRQPGASRQRGMTLIEMMIVLVILAIVSSMAGPSFSRQIRNNRVETSANSLMAGFNLARAEAIRRGRNIKICAVNDPNVPVPVCAGNWTQGWMIFLDIDDNGSAGDAGDVVIKVGTAMTGVAFATAAPAALVEFSARGQPVSGAGNYVLEPSSCDVGKDKEVTVELGTVGRSKASSGTCT